MYQGMVLRGVLAGMAMEQLSCKASGKFELIPHRMATVMFGLDKREIAQDGVVTKHRSEWVH